MGEHSYPGELGITGCWGRAMGTMTSINWTFVAIFTCRVSFAEILGTRYSKGSVLLCTFDEDIPVFGKIIDMIAISPADDCFFVLCPLVGSYFLFTLQCLRGSHYKYQIFHMQAKRFY